MTTTTTTATTFDTNADTVGNTPLVQLHKIVPTFPGAAKVWAKIESRNPGFSVKCRIGAAMIEDAEKSGILKPGMEIVEPTSGNTGIAIAYAGSIKGYKVTIVMPESFSVERRKVLKAFGATLVLTEKAKGMSGAVAKAFEMATTDKGRYWVPMQFENPSNPAAHERTTGPEIWNALGDKADVLVSGVGTGGTITGTSRFMKRMNPKFLSVAVEPAESPVLTQTRAGLPLKPAPHAIQGIGAGFVPKTLDLSVVDRIETITGPEALEMARRLAFEEGILSGVSSGAAVAVAAKLAAMPEFSGKNIVVILPDSGERYLTGALFEGVFHNIESAKAGDTI